MVKYNPNMSLSLDFLILTGVFFIDVNICKASPVIAPIITDAPHNAYPFVVSIQVKRGMKMPWTHSRLEHSCGGSLITRKHVLTAAHCYRKKYRYRVLVGSNDLQSDNVYSIRSWLTYDKWAVKNNIIAKYARNDISIVELSSLVDAGIKLAKITSATDDELRDQQVLTAGWGRTSLVTKPRYMVEVQLTMISRRTCVRNVRAVLQDPMEFFNLEENIICTNGDPYAVLYCGDSGSPLFWKENEIIGINECICPLGPDGKVTTKEQNLHVDVRRYSDFISAVNDNCTIEESTSVSRCWVM